MTAHQLILLIALVLAAGGMLGAGMMAVMMTNAVNRGVEDSGDQEDQ